ncbi:hypothetical protein R3P38DRAFT_3348649 [Favolaschia claudopus]|uniref:Uncharacterized protein n=1 Tax=Favolaschia claudopus TaxID=2862362 RepID=A0AAW0CV92_9AGAR
MCPGLELAYQGCFFAILEGNFDIAGGDGVDSVEQNGGNGCRGSLRLHDAAFQACFETFGDEKSEVEEVGRKKFRRRRTSTDGGGVECRRIVAVTKRKRYCDSDAGGLSLRQGFRYPQNPTFKVDLSAKRRSPRWEGDVRFKIACVEFKTVSHDQGWVSDGSLADPHRIRAGTYRGYTWFEAAIFRPSQLRNSSRARSSLTTGFNGYRAWDSDLEVVHTPPTTATEDDNRQTESTEKETETETKTATARAITRWNIQHNLCASKEHKDHRVVWTSTSTSSSQNGYDDEAANATINSDGSGNGIGFIENLKAGDQIAVISRAMYTSWVNYIKYVEVSVFYGLA